MVETFDVKDSGQRASFESGMVRDTSEGKLNFSRVLSGPMFFRWVVHLEKGAIKYPDPEPGISNWTLAKGLAEFLRFRISAFRHFIQWFIGMRDEDHAAAVFFNINGAEYVREKMTAEELQKIENFGTFPKL